MSEQVRDSQPLPLLALLDLRSIVGLAAFERRKSLNRVIDLMNRIQMITDNERRRG